MHLNNILTREPNWIGHILRRNVLPHDVIQDEMTEMKGVGRLAAHGAIGCGQKSFKLVWGCHQLLSGFLANFHCPVCDVKDVHMWAGYVARIK